jgi:hypothetical protein
LIFSSYHGKDMKTQKKLRSAFSFFNHRIAFLVHIHAPAQQTINIIPVVQSVLPIPVRGESTLPNKNIRNLNSAEAFPEFSHSKSRASVVELGSIVSISREYFSGRDGSSAFLYLSCANVVCRATVERKRRKKILRQILFIALYGRIEGVRV